MRRLTGPSKFTENTGQFNILLVDDHPENLIALKAVLSSPNYHLVTASSGEEALKSVLRQDFAVILLDVQMPGLDGFETAKLIKAREKTKHIPIIFVTAASQASEHVKQGYAVGAIDYIFKPYSPDMLRVKVDAFVKIYENNEYIKRLVNARTEQLKTVNAKLREEIEERQKMAESFYSMFQASPCLMAIRALDDGRFIETNQSWLNYTGYQQDEFSGQTSDLLQISAASQAGCFGSLQDLGNTVRNTHITYLTKSGEKREGLLSTEQVELDRKPCLLIVITDISEQAKLERQIARLDRLYLIGEMAAGIAHEIRNPMTTIRGFLQMSRNKGCLLPAHADLMMDELDRANSIITEFLTLAKDKRVERELKSLNEIIKALFPLIQAEAVMGNKAVKLALGNCPLLNLDDKEIRQLILNLSMNGLEAMAEGGELTIKTYCEDKAVVLEVQDEGAGIKEELLEQIMRPFFTTKETGTGLGLPICYSVAARHDAAIDVVPRSDGTTFLVRFTVS